MSDQTQFYNLLGPILARTACIAVTATSAAVELSADVNVGPAFLDGQLLRLYADGADVYYGFAVDGTTITAIDDASTGTTAGRCQCIAKGTYVDVCMPWLNGSPCTFLYVKTATGATATLRISPRSLDDKTKGF